MAIHRRRGADGLGRPTRLSGSRAGKFEDKGPVAMLDRGRAGRVAWDDPGGIDQGLAIRLIFMVALFAADPIPRADGSGAVSIVTSRQAMMSPSRIGWAGDLT